MFVDLDGLFLKILVRFFITNDFEKDFSSVEMRKICSIEKNSFEEKRREEKKKNICR